MSFNKVILMGNVGRDCELKSTSSGTSVANFSVAATNKYGEKEETYWGNVVVWGKLAETCGKYVKKGSKVLVEGRLSEKQWESDGVTKRKTEIVASNVRFIGGGKSEGAPAEEAPDIEPF